MSPVPQKRCTTILIGGRCIRTDNHGKDSCYVVEPMYYSPPTCRHDWRFDGDDPYLVCALCHEHRDALSGETIS